MRRRIQDPNATRRRWGRRWLPLMLAGWSVWAAACAEDPLRTSGGELLPEQAAYDVLHYDLAVRVDPEERAIDGRLTVRAAVLEPIGEVVLDLDRLLRVDSVLVQEGSHAPFRPASFRRRDGRLRVRLEAGAAPGDTLRVAVRYGGSPREAPYPPWEGGFTWAVTAEGRPWIGVSCQAEGPDLWWPAKDHPSDEPDSMAIRITVPESLTAVSNGRLRGVVEEADGMRTFVWQVTMPINPYGVTLNVAPYRLLEAPFTHVTGEPGRLQLWVLPEHVEEGRGLLAELDLQMRFLEQLLGPHPFRADKVGVVETPYLGMEHQTVIAYGDRFRPNAYGFDWLLLHELAHEWFANLATVPDWSHLWVHEGFATYIEALYAERLGGPGAYRAYMGELRGRIAARRPLVPERPTTSTEMYFAARLRQSDADVYMRGAWVLHTLRFLLGDEGFFTFLRRAAYPHPALEARTDGAAARFVTSADVRRLAESVSGRDLGWFFDTYLRHESLPELRIEREDGLLRFRWVTPGPDEFALPIEIRLDGELRRIDMGNGRAELDVPAGTPVEVDPNGWLLKK